MPAAARLKPLAALVILGGLVAVSSCARKTVDPSSVTITYHQETGNQEFRPTLDVTIQAPGLVRVRCHHHCAVTGELAERVPDSRVADVVDAFRRSTFFSLTREDAAFGHCDHCDDGTLTYRDARGIHEVAAADRRLPELVALVRQMSNVDRLTTPSPELYQRRLSDGDWTLDSLDEHRLSPLDVAAGRCQAESVAYLLDHGARVPWSAVENAFFCADPAIASRLVEARPIDPQSLEARRLLVRTAGRRNLPLVRLLLDRGLDVNAADDGGITPLMASFGEKSWEVVDLLLLRHANPNAVDRAGRTMLTLAVADTGALTLLVKYGAKLDKRDADGRTALMHAAASCTFWGVEALLSLGADPTLTDRDGKTAADFHLPPGDADYDKCAPTAKTLAASNTTAAVR